MQAADYGQCVQANLEHITRGVCSVQFQRLLLCAQKSSKKYVLVWIRGSGCCFIFVFPCLSSKHSVRPTHHLSFSRRIRWHAAGAKKHTYLLCGPLLFLLLPNILIPSSLFYLCMLCYVRPRGTELARRCYGNASSAYSPQRPHGWYLLSLLLVPPFFFSFFLSLQISLRLFAS